MYYAQITNGVVSAITETSGEHTAPDMIAIQSLDASLLGCSYADGMFIPPPPPVAPRRATKRAFQNRFPLLANGISTKWDAMTQFLTSDSYADSLGVSGAAMHALRMLIATGVNRMTASPFVDMAPAGEAAGLVVLLMQPSIPAVFRLSQAEHDAMMNTPLADSERYVG